MSESNGSPRLKGRSFVETRSAVLDLIRSEGEISRSAIARRSSLTEKTISGIVKSLLEAGVIIEAGRAESTGGKRPVLLRLNDKELFAIGVSLARARCLLVLCALDGTEIARSELRGTHDEQPALVLKRIAASLQRLLQRRDVDKASIIGVCVAMGGRLAALHGWQSGASFVDVWERYPTEKELTRLTGLAVIRENDANCAALGQYWTTGTSARDFATVYMTHGIGCGIVLGGSLYRGVTGNAGEIGHTLTDPSGDVCWCGRRGCLNTTASPRALTERILADAELRQACGVTADTEFGAVYSQFADAVVRGSRPAVELFERACDHIAWAVVNLVNTLDLDLVTLSGPGFAQLGNAYRTAIDERLNMTGFRRDVRPTTVQLGVGGADAAALGAASVVLHRELTPHHAATPL